MQIYPSELLGSNHSWRKPNLILPSSGDALRLGGTCDASNIDPYGRLVAMCSAGGVDLAGAIEAGMAVALPQFSDAYVERKARRRSHRIGI